VLHLHPQGGEKCSRRNLQGKFVSAPRAQQVHPGSQFCRTFLLGGGDLEAGVVYLIVLDHLFSATTKKVVNFFEEKSAPQTKCWLRLWERVSNVTSCCAVTQ